MNEGLGQAGSGMFDPQGGVSAGALLREARDAAGLHVAALAVALKVPVRKLEALEADRFDLLPDAVFVRALAASVCRTLKIDPAPVLARLPQTGAPRLATSEGGINAPFRSPGDAAGPTWLEHLSRPVFLAVFALLLGALVLILLPSVQREEAAPLVGTADVPPAPVLVNFQAPTGPGVTAAGVSPEVRPGAAIQATALTPAGPTLPAPGADVAVPAVAKPMTAAQSAAASATATRAIIPPVMPTAIASSAATAAPAGPAAPAPAAGMVVFKAKAASWVQVTDAKGTLTLRKLLAPGESAAASGVPPLAVTVGSASATEVEVRGKRFDLAPLARDNVARFEVK